MDRRGRSDPLLKPAARTTGLLVLSEKCLRADDEAEWHEWQESVRLPALCGDGGLGGSGSAWTATRFELTDRPRPGMPGLGFTHVTILELDGDDVVVQAAGVLDRNDDVRAAGHMHPAHVTVAADVFAAHGPHSAKPAPSPALRGHILAHVMPADPTLEAEWDAWYDEQHVPDMLACGAFGAMTRWVRLPRNRVGPNHLTLYDVACDTVEEAVERSAAVMPGIVAAGRKHPCHTGALTLTLRRV